MRYGLYLTLFASLIFLSCRHKTDESTAIKKILEKESATWRAADFKGHADCWQIQPYSRILVSTADGNTYDVDPENMKNPKTPMGNGGISVNTNYKMNITGNNAWVSHNEESTSKEGKKIFSYEIRILEKIKGQWKLVAQSIHQYYPK
jgi:hypothetical protein